MDAYSSQSIDPAVMSRRRGEGTNSGTDLGNERGAGGWSAASNMQLCKQELYLTKELTGLSRSRRRGDNSLGIGVCKIASYISADKLHT